MTILNIAIIIFVLMEIGNVLILYFAPDSKLGNGVAVFNPWFKAKEDEATELFAKYMANWVAGVKLIFIVLLLVILFVGNDITKLFAVFAMILSIATYYFRLNPIIKKLDNMGEITPKGYSKTLFVMITGFMLMFSTAVVIYFFVR
ncbi:MAG: hypothetical protein RR444_09210 [Oscillospiraceae bacterium]